MKRTILCLIAIAWMLFLASSAVSAAPRKIYEFPQQPSSKVVANMLQQAGFNSPPAIETNQEIRVEDATMVLESGNYDTVRVGASDIVYIHGYIMIQGTITVEPGAYILPASQNSGIVIRGGATSNWGAPDGEFVQILGDPATTDTEFGTSGILMEPNSSTVIHNVLVAGVGLGVVTTVPFAGAQAGSEPPPATCEATSLYLTNNNVGIRTGGSVLLDLRQSAAWNNTDYALQILFHVRMSATESWFQGNIELRPSGLNQKVVFDRCTLPDGFVDWLYASRDNGKFSALDDEVTVLENRPGGLGQTRVVQVYPLASPFSPADFTGSGEVNVEDVALLSQAFGSPRDDIEFGNLYDLNHDGMVNLPDMLPLAYAFAGVARSEPITTLAKNPKMPEFLSTIVQYPAVVAAAKVDPEFGPIIQSYLDIQTAVAEVYGEVPSSFSLGQNYPNPFNPETTIQFSISENADVVLAVYNTTGQVVARLVNEPLSAGLYNVQWDGRMESGQLAASGMYFYRLTADEYTEMRRMTLLR